MKINVKFQKKLILLLIAALLVATALIAALKSNVFNKNLSSTKKDTAQNSVSADSLIDEKNNAPQIVTDKTAKQIEQSDQTPSDSAAASDSAISQPSYDEYGPSTKLDRPNVHAVSLGLYSIYSKYLFALQNVDSGQRQSTSNQYISDNKDSFSKAYYEASINSVANLSLLHQSPELSLPASIRIGSAIVSPSDPTIVIGQVLMDPDVPWSIIVNVKLKDSLGNFGTIESTYVRQNRNPL